MTDVDRPSTWKSYRAGLCSGCIGACCTMPVEVKLEDLVRLGVVDEDEASRGAFKKIASRLKKEKIISSFRKGTDLFMLAQKANRDCVFLDSRTRLCVVYEKRPGVCRDFPAVVGPRPGFCPVAPK